MKKIFTKEVIIGTCVICAIVILVVGIEFLKGINVFKPANFYIAQYDNVAGLETAAPVTIDGFKVGQVREINFNYENPGKIDVVLALNKHLHLPEDSKAVIGSTLLSGSYVEIKLGSSEKKLDVGGFLQTEMEPDLMSSISSGVIPAVESLVPKVNSLLVSLNKLASDPALVASIQSLEGITAHINNASANLDLMMAREVPGVLKNVDGITMNLDTITNDLAELSYKLKQLPIETTIDNVNYLTSNLVKFSNDLNNQNSSLGLLMNSPELYNRLNTVVSDVDSLILDIKKNPKRYISIKLL